MALAILTTMGTGAMMGAMHALLGPDHMSALLTLTVNRPPVEAAWLGIRWGLGHSAGLLVVTAFFLVLRDSSGLDQQGVLDAFQGGMDWAVGAIMLCLGFWGYHGAWQLRRRSGGATVGRGISGTTREMRGVAALQLVDEAFTQDQGPRRAREPHGRALPLPGGAGGDCGAEAAVKGSAGKVRGQQGVPGRPDQFGGVHDVYPSEVEAGLAGRGRVEVGGAEVGDVNVLGAACKGREGGGMEGGWGGSRGGERAGAALGQVECRGGELGQTEMGQDAPAQGLGAWEPNPATGTEPRSERARLYLDGAGSGVGIGVEAAGEWGVADRPCGFVGVPAAHSARRRALCSGHSGHRGRPAGRKTAYEAAIALGVGVLHGVGGPGGVLGVLPSLLMPGLASSLAYLLSFCASATVTMGAVAICCGLLSSRSAEACRSPRLPWILAVAAATLSIAVGVLWIVGCATGRLEEMIHGLGME